MELCTLTQNQKKQHELLFMCPALDIAINQNGLQDDIVRSSTDLWSTVEKIMLEKLETNK
jgi:hypothetical protein